MAGAHVRLFLFRLQQMLPANGHPGAPHEDPHETCSHMPVALGGAEKSSFSQLPSATVDPSAWRSDLPQRQGGACGREGERSGVVEVEAGAPTRWRWGRVRQRGEGWWRSGGGDGCTGVVRVGSGRRQRARCGRGGGGGPPTRAVARGWRTSGEVIR
ncbi:unnamed protein product [Miscanthus lutarioriparius]|uniref:Uncharacterized protein n=1 Tax=Miscanthus lutarioriparius TaxID=422564 RepID=A0A811PJ85_9POAL|nr:unnamed protein product [Miscanthus lutarioriparius]